MLCTNIVVVEIASLFHGVFNDFFCSGRLGKLAHGNHVRTGLDYIFNFQADLTQINAEIFQNAGGNAAAFFDQTQEDMFRSNIFVIETLRFLVGKLHDPASAICKPFVHV